MNYLDDLYMMLDRPDVQTKAPMDPAAYRGHLFCEYPHDCMKAAFPNAVITTNPKKHVSAVLVWGHSVCTAAMNVARRERCPILLCEDGFVRSVDTWCHRGAHVISRRSVSITVDPYGYYFDAGRRSGLVRMLDSDLQPSPAELAHAHAFMTTLVERRISKYNHQPLTFRPVGRPGVPKVLVVDQSFGDFAIRRGGANAKTFQTMLDDAIAGHPDCDILVKTHPDALAHGSKRKGYYQHIQQHDNVYPIREPVNPYALMELVDDVYVCTSQLGLEALMAGKRVHVYGKPFYAGWGLTDDHQDMSRQRHRTRTLDELVYITYFLYIHWNNPVDMKPCSAETAIQWIQTHRTPYVGVYPPHEEPPCD